MSSTGFSQADQETLARQLERVDHGVNGIPSGDMLLGCAEEF